MEETALSRLANVCGIDPDYLNYKKDHTEISVTARSGVLKLLGNIETEAQAEAELQRLSEADWRQVLPQTLIQRSGLPVQVELNFTTAELAQSWSISILMENGEQQLIAFSPDSCAETATKCVAGTTYSRRLLLLEIPLPEGYHRLSLLDGDGHTRARCRLCIAPQTAYQPPLLANGKKVFGISVQLYTVRSARNWGIGDFTDLVRLMHDAAALGVDVVGVNPLHALFPANPLHYSPYSPSNRAFLNVLYLDVEAQANIESCTNAIALIATGDFQERLATLRAAHNVDYQGVADAKLPVMEMVYAQFCQTHLNRDSERADEFRQYLEAQGSPLIEHATYDALHEHFLNQDASLWGWPVWPEAFRSPGSNAVKQFTIEHGDRIQYFQYLQWCACKQLLNAQSSAQESGMAIGMYLDLAVGVDLSGSEVWSNQSAFSLEASAGAPPDELARSGQDWGFPPLSVHADKLIAYQLFVRNLQANMALCGAVRYDHAVSLLRLWWMPRGVGATEGAYVNYPMEDLLGLLALESQRNQCLVIGEDLGTVPMELRTVMRENHLYSYRVLYFEKSGQEMTAPENYPQEAVATVSTHDLPTLASWWDGSDLVLRQELGLLGDSVMVKSMITDRTRDKQLLLDALTRSGCWHGVPDIQLIPDMTEQLNCAVHQHLASSASAVMICQIEDIMQMLTPVNVPGTFKEHANWQRKLRHPIEDFFERGEVRTICALMEKARRLN